MYKKIKPTQFFINHLIIKGMIILNGTMFQFFKELKLLFTIALEAK